MTALDRRRMLALAMAMLPALAAQRAQAQVGARTGGIGGAVSPAQPALTITPPPRPMVYTRRLERTLVGDARIIVERRFAIRFTRAQAGYIVEGEQTAVSVETPEQLAALAQMERERVEIGIFPLELDQRGWIRSGVTADEEPEIEAAMRYVALAVATLERGEDQLRSMRDFVAAVHQAGSNIVSSLPTDLFAPAQDTRTDQRAFDLPVGGQGVVRTHFTASRDPATGLMASARREVITTIAQDERRTTEIFTLAA